MIRFASLSTSLLLLIGFGFGCTHQQPETASVRYEVRFPNVTHNEAEITLTLDRLNPVPVQVAMSRTSPGRYALHEFAKNIYNVRVTDSSGDTLEVHRSDLHRWIVSGHDGTINFTYTLYANHADGTYSGVNEKHAHLNMPATFVWPQGIRAETISVHFDPPEDSDWRVATQLKPTEDPFTFTAPDLYYFLDSPTELSDFEMSTWKVPVDTTEYTIRLAVHHNGSREEVARYAEMAQKVVNEQIAVFGEPPHFEFGTYTFIADYLPYVYGDGMEHRNSTILTSRRALKGDGAMRNLNTLSHEYFHGWNVERLRPQSLEPFNFLEANVSGLLWFAEGFTSYYDGLIIRRTGLINNGEFAESWEGTLNYVLNSPGSDFYNPIEMSRQAPFVDAATSVDEQNKVNTFISYYSWGAVLGLGLDLMLRTEFDEVTLDDYMKTLWQKYGKPENSYEVDDLQETLAEVTDSTEFAESFFDRYVYKGSMINFKPLFARAGFLLKKEFPGQAVISFGNQKIGFDGNKARVAEKTIIGSPLYNAGIDQGDVLLSLEGRPIPNARALRRQLAGHRPGETLDVRYESLGTEYEANLVLAENPQLELVTYEQAGKEVTEEIKKFRENWLGSKVKSEQ